MNRDEREIRDLVASWMKATREGDSETVLNLMADDAIFLVPGLGTLRKGSVRIRFQGFGKSVNEE